MAAVKDYNQKINEAWQKIKDNAISKLETYLNTGDSSIIFTKKEWSDYYT